MCLLGYADALMSWVPQTTPETRKPKRISWLSRLSVFVRGGVVMEKDAVQYCTSYTILYSTILYYTVLYYTKPINTKLGPLHAESEPESPPAAVAATVCLHKQTHATAHYLEVHG